MKQDKENTMSEEAINRLLKREIGCTIHEINVIISYWLEKYDKEKMRKKELQEENKQLKEQLERKMDLIGELDGYFEDIFTELDRNWREDEKWQGGMKGWYEEAIREIKELKEQLDKVEQENIILKKALKEMYKDLSNVCKALPSYKWYLEQEKESMK